MLPPLRMPQGRGSTPLASRYAGQARREILQVVQACDGARAVPGGHLPVDQQGWPAGEGGYFRQVAIGEAHPQLGAQLEVRLINLNIPGPPATPGIEVNFDDVRLVTGCPATGDLDEDDDVDLDDVTIFIDVLLGVDADPEHLDLADMNCSETADGDDVSLFVESLLN